MVAVTYVTLPHAAYVTLPECVLRVSRHGVMYVDGWIGGVGGQTDGPVPGLPDCT